MFQAACMDKRINRGIKENVYNSKEISDLTTTKKGLLETANRLARDNGLAQPANAAKMKSANTLTHIQKEMVNDGVFEAKANFVDAKILNTLADIAGVLGSLPSLAALATAALTKLAPNLGISM